MPFGKANPQTAEELAATLRDATAQRVPVVPCGAGTRQHIGHAPPADALMLRTGALERITEHVAADMTVTAEAGITLGALQAALAAHGQWLPWDPPLAAQATLGGLLATAASGPLRLGYGTPRDWVLGMQVALGDGRLVKSGGKVVKNVAGYDLHKLQIGALGTLGVLTSVTLKVFPLPEASQTLLFACADQAAALRLADVLRERPFAPTSLIVLNRVVMVDLVDDIGALGDDGCVLCARWAGVAAAVARQAQAAQQHAEQAHIAAAPLEADRARVLWQQLADFSAPAAGRFILRAAAAPAQLDGVLAALDAHIPLTKQATGVIGYPGVGVCYARLALPPQLDLALAAQALAALRSALAPLGGYAVVEDAPPALRAALDLWGPLPNLALMQSLRRQWDPGGVLNPGRYLPGG